MLLDQRDDEISLEGVEPIVHVVECGCESNVALGVRVDREAGQPVGLVAHLHNETAQLGLDRCPVHAPDRLADIAGKVAGALEIPVQPHRGRDDAQIAGHGLLQREEP